ncbi:class I SAM-dependent methyltransferase [Usitatibacter palustris]|uniref:Ubiquinone biosynthesis O-methyltransferase, mitochondrial n=1 Tax=Usitatibacter palustris TaxID=2732487 RepID=A0A6M4H3H4_9PROT|nr:class I SAM-dependent methyltransferase [Usitatibacter palustris]QJR14129.1 Ubiquinone biosynthesis O-methyltransferase, mitochondrial [Usitatibacter palustris]
MNDELEFTGERFIPGVKGEIWVEHWHRYHFASRWVAGKRVLDMACGEGYGSALLARGAEHVTGADISEQAIAHARAAYAKVSNLEFANASCAKLPWPDASFDVAVTFETIEHIDTQEAFMDELARVLKPDGVLVMSCPNKSEYSDRRNFKNEFHVKELYRAELAKLVGDRFPEVSWYGQRPSFFSVIAPENGTAHSGELFEVSEAHPQEASPALGAPLYFVVIASRRRVSIALPPAVSVFSDLDDWVHKDYEKVMKWLEQSAAHGQALTVQLAQRDADAAQLRAAVESLRAERAWAQATSDTALAQRDARIAEAQAALAARDAEVRRRGGLRWWLKLPFVRFGLMKDDADGGPRT